MTGTAQGGDTGRQDCPITATGGPYRDGITYGGLVCWLGFSVACTFVLIALDVVSLGVGIAAMMLAVGIAFVGYEAVRATNRTRDRLVFVLTVAVDAQNRDRAAEYGAIMRRIESVGTQAEAVLSDWGQRVEDMYVACDAAEGRRNVERTEQVRKLHARVDEMSETYAGELLAINGALSSLRADISAVLALQLSPELRDTIKEGRAAAWAADQIERNGEEGLRTVVKKAMGVDTEA